MEFVLILMEENIEENIQGNLSVEKNDLKELVF